MTRTVEDYRVAVDQAFKQAQKHVTKAQGAVRGLLQSLAQNDLMRGRLVYADSLLTASLQYLDCEYLARLRDSGRTGGNLFTTRGRGIDAIRSARNCLDEIRRDAKGFFLCNFGARFRRVSFIYFRVLKRIRSVSHETLERLERKIHRMCNQLESEGSPGPNNPVETARLQRVPAEGVPRSIRYRSIMRGELPLPESREDDEDPSAVDSMVLRRRRQEPHSNDDRNLGIVQSATRDLVDLSDSEWDDDDAEQSDWSDSEDGDSSDSERDDDDAELSDWSDSEEEENRFPGPPSLCGDGSLGDGPLDLLPDESQTCKICFEKSITQVIIPCGHAALCTECKKQVYKQGDYRCPFCRQGFAGIYCLRVP